MSPPCQPFSRQGKQLGGDDPRTSSFLHLLDIFPQLSEHKPKSVLLANIVSHLKSMLAQDLKQVFLYVHAVGSSHFTVIQEASTHFFPVEFFSTQFGDIILFNNCWPFYNNRGILNKVTV